MADDLWEFLKAEVEQAEHSLENGKGKEKVVETEKELVKEDSEKVSEPDEDPEQAQRDLLEFLGDPDLSKKKTRRKSSADVPVRRRSSSTEAKKALSALSQDSKEGSRDAAPGTARHVGTEYPRSPLVSVAPTSSGPWGSSASPVTPVVPLAPYVVDEELERRSCEVDESVPKPDLPQYQVDESGDRIFSHDKRRPCHRFVFTAEEAPFSQGFSDIELPECIPMPVPMLKREVPLPLPPYHFAAENEVRLKILLELWAAQSATEQVDGKAPVSISYSDEGAAKAAKASSPLTNLYPSSVSVDHRKTAYDEDETLSSEVLMLNVEHLSSLNHNWRVLGQGISQSAAKLEVNPIGKVILAKVHIAPAQAVVVRVPYDVIDSFDALQHFLCESLVDRGMHSGALARKIARRKREREKRNEACKQAGVSPPEESDPESEPSFGLPKGTRVEDFPPMIYQDSDGDFFKLDTIQAWDDCVHDFECSPRQYACIHLREDCGIHLKVVRDEEEDLIYFADTSTLRSFSDIKTTLVHHFSLPDDGVLRYKDKENDLVDVRSQGDWDFAILAAASTTPRMAEGGIPAFGVVVYV